MPKSNVSADRTSGSESTSGGVPVAVYLRGERVGFRAPRVEDGEFAQAWMLNADNPYAMGFAFPISKARAEKQLKAEETSPWGNGDMIRLVAIDLKTHEIVGGAAISREQGRIGWVRSQVAPSMAGDETDEIELDMASLLVTWARTELDLMVIEYVVAGDRHRLIRDLGAHGFVEGTRLREAIRGPRGRVDLLWLESVNPAWGSRFDASEEPSRDQ